MLSVKLAPLAQSSQVYPQFAKHVVPANTNRKIMWRLLFVLLVLVGILTQNNNNLDAHRVWKENMRVRKVQQNVVLVVLEQQQQIHRHQDVPIVLLEDTKKNLFPLCTSAKYAQMDVSKMFLFVDLNSVTVECGLTIVLFL